MLDNRPEAVVIRTPAIITKKCPGCSREMEILSNERQTRCSSRRFTIYDDLEPCLQWCK